ncbi:glycosyl transferase [Sphingobium sp. SCG-1]|uniref:glycosyltransferase family 2 protein n=1 Tax=Sphingobium sp. SCG-1 TaxID=2072936 RepID=UPI000CD6B32D|nr:glycosyltransferase family 2 protein [Sphingobium sp. SCG-1]AUW57331.1 glycosyl transferase [Sphingobium sp. SCG-1]
MHSGPIVTVVIPTFGRAQLLRRAIASVLTQTAMDFEIIVVVDGDDPATLQTLGEIADHRLRHIVQPVQRGPGVARNTGAIAGKGQWVAFLDDDDEWLPEKLERQLALVPRDGSIDPARVLLVTLTRVMTPQGPFIRPTEAYSGDRPLDEWLFDRRSWLKGGQSFLQTSSFMLPRSLFDQLQFADSRLHEDWELILRAVKEHGCTLLTAPYPLVVHYVGEARPSLSRNSAWERSLKWADSVGRLLTPRAYAGFCLTVIAQSAAADRQWQAFIPLLRAAFHNGRPTFKQLFAFALLWMLPDDLRRRIRARVQGER